jgi:hypothetical protein
MQAETTNRRNSKLEPLPANLTFNETKAVDVSRLTADKKHRTGPLTKEEFSNWILVDCRLHDYGFERLPAGTRRLYEKCPASVVDDLATPQPPNGTSDLDELLIHLAKTHYSLFFSEPYAEKGSARQFVDVTLTKIPENTPPKRSFLAGLADIFWAKRNVEAAQATHA